MASAATSNFTQGLSEGQRAALINLLADDDPGVYSTIRRKIVSCGPPAAEWLRPHTRSADPALRRRAQEIVTHFDRQAADDRFLGFCLKYGEDLNLEEGAWLLSKTRYPEINIEAYRAVLDGYAADLKQRLKVGSNSREILECVNNYLFDELGFVGNERGNQDAEDNYLNRVIDRRTGNPINLSVVYMLLARRLGLPIAGIGLPGHFICRYQSSAGEVYIDPFNCGKLLTKLDCVQYLARESYGVRDDYLCPVSPRRILLRICGNLHQVYTQTERADETVRIQRYLVALAR